MCDSVCSIVKRCRHFKFYKSVDICFCLRSPDNATVKQKMLYTSSKDALKKSLRGIGKEVQATDDSELAWSVIMEVLLRTEVAH